MFYKLVTIDDPADGENGPHPTLDVWFVCRANSIREARAIAKLCDLNYLAGMIWQEASEEEYFSFLYYDE